jgi:ribosomal-protein-alanine N-acetyltransferase
LCLRPFHLPNRDPTWKVARQRLRPVQGVRGLRPMPDRLLFVVQPMTLADLDQVMAIEQVAFPSPWSKRAYRYEVAENEHSRMIVVRPAPRTDGWLGRFVGSFGLTGSSPIMGYSGFWMLVDEIHISTIAVHPQWRRRGLGELLLVSLLDLGAELDARRATLEVRISNLAAQGLYHKYGFEIVSRQKRYYADNNEDAYIMATPPLDSIGFRANLRQCRARLHARLQAGGPDTQRLQDR